MTSKLLRSLARAPSVIIVGVLLWGAASPARADWTWNVGYQNPAVSTVGLNLFYIGPKWGFETGIGWVDVRANADDDADNDKDDDGDGVVDEDGEKDDDDGASLRLAGDVDLKYFLGSGGARVFLQAGLGIGIGAAAGDNSGVGAGTGAPFGGVGALFGGPSLYAYVSGNVRSDLDPFLQAGIGFDL
jgi:hypothetical protein